MSQYRVNKVVCKFQSAVVKIWITDKELPNFQKRRTEVFSEFPLPYQMKGVENLYCSFHYHSEAIEFDLNLESNPYFIRPYLDSLLSDYFAENGLSFFKDFTQAIQVWQYSPDVKNIFYERFTLRLLN